MINVPEAGVETLEQLVKSLQAKKDSLHDTIVVYTHDIARLKGIVVAENYTISEQSKKKAELTEQTEALIVQKNTTKAELEAIESEIKKSTSKLNEVETNIIQLNKTKEAVTLSLEEKRNEMNIKEAKLNEIAISLTAREQNLNQREKELENKHNVIKSFKESL